MIHILVILLMYHLDIDILKNVHIKHLMVLMILGEEWQEIEMH